MAEAPTILGMQQLSRVAGEQGQCYEAYVAKEEAREKYLQNFSYPISRTVPKLKSKAQNLQKKVRNVNKTVL